MTISSTCFRISIMSLHCSLLHITIVDNSHSISVVPFLPLSPLIIHFLLFFPIPFFSFFLFLYYTIQIHDEVILEGPKESMPLAMAEVRSCMERPFDEVLKSLKGKSHI